MDSDGIILDPKPSSAHFPLMANDQQVTWGGRFKESPTEKMIQFGSSIDFDTRLAPYDLLCSKAHSAMLCHVGIISEKERDSIHQGLDQVGELIEAGTMDWDEKLEDVHMNIEQKLISITPAGAKVHTARSRNDQIATDMNLFLKDACAHLTGEIEKCILALLDHAEREIESPAPSYTHLQRAQPITLAHYLLSWVEMFSRDIDQFRHTFEMANVCPLGSGALAGTTLPIDREFTAKYLGFVNGKGEPNVSGNSLDTVASRDAHMTFAYSCTQTAIHLSRLAEEWILWASSEFSFINLPDSYTTGSSLMPQKRNPDALELSRGKSARIAGNLAALTHLVKAQPLTYNRDLQEDKPPVFDSFDQLSQTLDLTSDLISKTTFDNQNLKKAASDPMLFATDIADLLVRKGVAFRDSHHMVGSLVVRAESMGVSLDKLSREDVSSIAPQISDEYSSIFDFKRSIEGRKSTGMPNPERNRERILHWRKKLGEKLA